MKMSNINSTVKPIEVKREDFRKYLEHAGVMDALTSILISLYEEQERPNDAFEYFRKHFNASDASRGDNTLEVEALKKDLAEAKLQIAQLKENLAKYEPSS